MKKTAFLLFLICFFSKSHSQNIQQNSSIFKSIPQEKIFVHYNTTFLLSGEQLLYKVYCLNSKTEKLTTLSKVAYVELIDKDFKVHFKHKVLLNSGLGQGDFFIPTTLKSGNYKIIAYTKWMKNGGENNFFQGDISILNPFADNSQYLSKDKEIKNLETEKNNINDNSDIIKLSLNKQEFKNREKVILQLDTDNNDILNGNYSLSVRKVGEFNIPRKQTTNTYQSLYNSKTLSKENSSKIYLPEFRGELISGKIIHKDSKEAISDVNISISIPGNDYIFKASKTDNSGTFYFNIDKTYNSLKAVLEIDDKNKEDYEIILDEDTAIDYKNIVFSNFSISEQVKKSIEKRSVFNQIENAYNIKKQDSVKRYINSDKFFGTNVYTYYLDDYTRFNTLKETLTEITGNIYYSKKGSEYSIKILGVDFLYKNLKPLILIDGIQILNHNDVIDFKTKQVNKIIVLQDNYVYGTKLYNGVVILETFKGDYSNLVSKSYQKNIDLFKPLVPKKYFKQNYDLGSQERIPDFRSQLFWQLDCKLSNRTNSYNFYTSDNVGLYEVSLEGFTKQGKPISLKTTFKVK
ncbi:hypothetical protein [Polaribacter sp. Asnod6-C07]|uniref:hypothetical protein n=1 Tax=Polaribacter sp. Asnod6-C07 TaxID=3160582 RepID=UPI0038642019